MKGLSEKVSASGFVLVCVLLGVGISSYLSVQKLIGSKQNVLHSYEVLEALSDTFEGVTDAESGRRGYLISRQKIYLETYNNGIQKVDQTLKTVQQLTVDNPDQQYRVNQLELLVARRLANLRQSINLLKQNQLDEAAQISFTDQGWEIQQEIRASLQIIRQEEKRLLQQRVAATDMIVRQMIIVVAVGFCLSLSLLLASYFLLQKQIHVRKLIEAALQKREEEFKAIVENSPDLISRSNPQLQYMYVNPATERKLDMPIHEIIGKTRAEIGFPAEFIHYLESCQQRVFATGEISVMEFDFPGSNGTAFYQNHIIPEFAPDGSVASIFNIARNITPLKQAEKLQAQLLEQLETEREQWEAIANNMTEGLMVVDLAGNILTMNPVALRLYEYQDIEQARRSLRKSNVVFEMHFLDGRSLPVEECPLARALKGETFSNYEIHLRKIDTGTSWFGRYGGAPVYNSAGEIIFTILTVSDISKRMRVDEELRQNEQRYRSLMVATSQIVWNTPDDGRFVAEQPDWSAFTGQTFNELKDFGWLNAVHPEDRHYTEQVWRKAIASRTLYEVEYRIRRHSGEYRSFAVRGVPLQEADGSIREWIGICADIDDRKRVEVALQKAHDQLEKRVQERTAALQQSERRYRSLVLASSDIVWTTDAAGDIVDDIPAWRELTGQSAAEVKGLGTLAAVHSLDRERTAQQWSYAIKMKRIYHIEHRVRLADGTYRFFLGCGVPVIDENGEIQEWIGTHTDITERKQIESALLQAKEELEIKVQQRTAELQKSNEDLRRSNQELEQFAYVASHDLQEPLRAVTGYTQLLVQDYEELLDEAALEYTGYIVDGAKRMQQLIQDLLIYSRVGTHDLKLVPTDCNTVLSQVLSNLQVTIAESNAIITYDSLPTVVADKTQVMQLLQNLIGNAIKFCREETPKIHISAVRGDGKTEDRGGYTPSTNEWVFTVRDNGIGIKPQYLERIFEIFKRLHTRREFPGTGIGLAICKKIVERHRGHIWVESQPKLGTTFYFTLPYYENLDV